MPLSWTLLQTLVQDVKSLRHSFLPQSTNTLLRARNVHSMNDYVKDTIGMGKPFFPFCMELNSWKEAKEVTHLTSCFWLNNPYVIEIVHQIVLGLRYYE